MHERALRTVLLVQAIEESDRAGEVLPLADRADATRTAARNDLESRDIAPAATLSPAVERFLIRRADRLRDHLLIRAPVVGQVLRLAGGASWLGRAILVAALISGISLSALDGARRINILAFPLLGLIAWNLVVYAALLVSRFRRAGASPAEPWAASLYERWIKGRIDALMKRSSQFNAPLAAALQRFAAEWSAIAHPLMALHARRLLHLAAACVALGLIGGLYVRGLVLRYEAGWESTFLGPDGARRLMTVLYWPASALSGIALPASSEEVSALRWTGSSGGGEAAAWIHLIAWTALIYIVIPRSIAALAASVRLWRLARQPALPPSLFSYVRALLIGAGGAAQGIASVTPYAYEPGRGSITGLETLLTALLGGAIKVDIRDSVRYGEEETFSERLAHGGARVADWHVLLMSLASTPESENHGAVLASLRDWLARSASTAPLLVVVDEAPYASRMQGDPSLEARIEERRRLWSDFVEGYGLRACIVDLSRIAFGTPAEEHARDAARAALWTARGRTAVS